MAGQRNPDRVEHDRDRGDDHDKKQESSKEGGFGSGVGESGKGIGDTGFGSSDMGFGGDAGGIGGSGFGSSDMGWGGSSRPDKDYGGFDSHGGFVGSDIKSGDQGFESGFGIEQGWGSKAWEGLSSSVADAWQGAKDWAFGKDFEGTAPMGTASQYGLTTAEFDATIGKDVYESKSLPERLAREIDYFSEAPMDYASDLMDNPLVAGAAMLTGTGMTAFGIKAVDAAIDLYQGEVDPIGAAQQTAAAGLSFTPIGAMMPGPTRGIAVAGLKEGAKAAAKKTAGVLGGTIGGTAGNAFADAVTDNVYARAAITAASTVGASWGGVKAVENAMESGKTYGGSLAETQKKAEHRQSALVSSGEKAVASSQRLMYEPVQTDLYAQTVKQLPQYGIGVHTPGVYQTQTYYGV